MIRPEGVPEEAEALDLMAQMERRAKPSKLVPGLEQLEMRLKCPRCEHERPFAGTFSKFNCGGCGLAMQATSTALFCWEQEPDAVPAREREHA
jgi:hypothetical protein